MVERNVALIVSAGAVGLSYFGPISLVWPLRNVVNTCLAVTAARALQLPKLPYIVLALGLLVGYDSFSVLGTGECMTLTYRIMFSLGIPLWHAIFGIFT